MAWKSRNALICQSRPHRAYYKRCAARGTSIIRPAVVNIASAHPCSAWALPRVSPSVWAIWLEVGSRIPLAGTATGHALFAALPDVERDYLFERLRERHQKHWAELEASINIGRREVEDVGYTTASASWNTDINGVAAPLILPGGASVYALACGAPARHLTQAKQRKIGQRLVEIARMLEEQLRSGAGTR